MGFALLTVLALTPLVGALLLLVVKGATAKWLGLVFSLITLVLAIVAALSFRPGAGMQLVEQVPWIPQFGAHYSLGLDGIGLTLVLLTTILVPVVLVASWTVGESGQSGESRWTARGFFGLVLALESASLYVFLATDVLLFYLFFELTLIPMYFLIGGFGSRVKAGRRRSYAAIKFLLFSLAGGLVMLASVIGLYVVSSQSPGGATYLLSELMNLQIPEATQRWLFLGFMFAFALKAPMVPFHTWLPDAAEESTPGAATLMVGVLDKIGTFGMIRFCLGLFPEASQWATPVVLVLAVISVLYGALAAIGQKNLMRLIAFTSISHFGFIVLGIFALTSQGVTGSTLYMLNHGFSTAALFLVVGFLISRRGSALITDFGGVQKVAPVLAGLTLIAGLSSLSLPGLSSFVSEFMVLAGTFSRYPYHAVVATLGIVLAALYILIMYQRTMTGPVTPVVRDTVTDLNGRERLALAPLVLLILVLGFFPRPALAIIGPSVTATLQHVGVTDPAPIVGEAGTN